MTHLDGVTELNVIHLMNSPWWVYVMILVPIVVVFILGIMLNRVQDNKYNIFFGIFAMLCVLCVSVGGIFKSTGCFNKVYDTQYEVIVDESVSHSEFRAHYEVIEQRNLIYVVKFKE